MEDFKESLRSEEPLITTNRISLRGPKGFWRNGWQTIMLMGMVIVGYNLTAVMIGLISSKWRIYEVGWPAEIILVGMLFAMVMVKTLAPWMLFPTGIVLGNGILLGFYALTGWWQAWDFLWPLEPLIALVTTGYALWLGARGDRKYELTEKTGHQLVKTAVLALVIVIIIAALPFG